LLTSSDALTVLTLPASPSMLATFNLRNRNYIYQCADDDDDDEQRRSDGVGGMGKV